jgi:hypothetical protein
MRSLCPRTSSNIGNWRDLCKASPAINCISTSLVIGNCFAVYSSGMYSSIVISAPNREKCLPTQSLQMQNTAEQEANSNAILQLAPEKTSNPYRYKSQPRIKRRHKSFENIWALGFLSQKYSDSNIYICLYEPTELSLVFSDLCALTSPEATF